MGETATKDTDAKGDFTLKLQKSRDVEKGYYTIYLKEIDETVWNGCQRLIRQEKELEAVRMLIRNLRVGGDAVAEVCANFYAVRAAVQPLLELIMPVDGTLKKN